MKKITDKRIVFFLVLLVTLVIFVAILYRSNLSPEDNQANATCGMIAYDWNKAVQQADKGFPKNEPPMVNFNWTTPVNYAEGVFYYRVQIKSQPVAQNMRLQLCFWQPEIGSTYKFGLENCGNQRSVAGEPQNVVEWTTPVKEMWKLEGNSIDWTRARFRAGVAVKNSQGDPVSNYNNWNWNGEDPEDWYPLDMRFTAVVVPKNGNFCGWDYYLNGGQQATNTPTLNISNTPTVSLTPSPTHTTVPQSSPTPTLTRTPGPSPTPSLAPIPTNTHTPGPTTTPTVAGNICGKADIGGDGVFTIADFAEFAKSYGRGTNTCADKDVDYGPCGGRDVNKDGKLNIADFGAEGIGFAQRYYPKTSCSL